MEKLSKRLISDIDGYGHRHITYWCQGCKTTHSVIVDGPNAWGYNGNPESPTFTPSVLSTSGHFMTEFRNDRCWCDYNREHPEEPVSGCYRCHTFITEGKVQFLGDCSHELAGQTLDLPEFPEGYLD